MPIPAVHCRYSGRVGRRRRRPAEEPPPRDPRLQPAEAEVLLRVWVDGGIDTNDAAQRHPRTSGFRARVLPAPRLCAWAHSVRGGRPEACRRDIRIRVICPMPAGS